MKIKSFLLALFAQLIVNTALAYDCKVDGICYDLNGNNKTAEVTYKYNKKPSYSGDVVIPEFIKYNGDNYSVTSIGYNTFYQCTGLTSITIPNSVTSIGSDAFSGCTGLTSLTIPNSLTTIGSDAFRGCNNIKKVIIPDIAAWCSVSFSNNFANPLYTGHLYRDENTEIKDLIIPNGVANIGDYAFSGCSGLTSITIPNSVTSIGYAAFKGCTGLTSITIPNSVTCIGEYNQEIKGETNVEVIPVST